MIFVLLNEISNSYLLLSGVQEPLTLLVFGISLVGVTAGLRRFFKRQDDEKEQ